MKILVIYYSQSGQIREILDNLIAGLNKYDLDIVKIEPEKDFPFPWTTFPFFDSMPETVLEEKMLLKKPQYKYEEYDLIILGYQPWYLSVSQPVISLLQSESFKRIIKNKPVITVIGARNMWINSQQEIVRHLKKSEGKPIANIPFTDRHNNQISALTILYWMLTGKKKKMLGIFPLPGVSKKDIDRGVDLGKLINDHLKNGNLNNLQKAIVSTGHIKIPTNILFIEKRAKKIFKLWAKLIKRSGKNKISRAILIRMFRLYVFLGLFVIAPVVLLFYNIFVLPFIHKSVLRQIEKIKANEF